jgi:DNA excision repair protein ERCC-2
MIERQRFFCPDDHQLELETELRDIRSVSRRTSSERPHTIPVSVREMVEFVLRTGSLGGERDFSAPSRALEGTRGHQRIQKQRPEGYQAEVRVKHDLPHRDFVLTIKGRIDGILEASGRLLIEEIKTVVGGWSHRADPLHWAQAKVYAYIFASERPGYDSVDLQLTYLDLDSGGLTEFREEFPLEDLREFFTQVTSVYLEWASRQHDWMKLRDDSIGTQAFPHTQYRAGQRKLAVAAYRALAGGTKLFAEAPTGIGKTVSVLFPAIKALGERHLEKIFFLTAKGTGRAIAAESLGAMRKSGLHLRSLTITAKDKICFNNGQPCEIQNCPFAIGYYDRVKPAVAEALSEESLGQPEIEALARRHNVCPYALSLDIALWADVIICDYNYVFDPKVSLKRFFAEEGGDYGFLVDEAHNLVDRAREMFSAELDGAEISSMRDQLRQDLPGCARVLRKIEKLLGNYRALAVESEGSSSVTREPPAEILSTLREFLKKAEDWLLLNEPAGFRAGLLQLYFRFVGFNRTAELYDERYATIFEGMGVGDRLRLFCLDPSQGIQKALRRGKAAVFFSATLRPIDYYREILGGEIGDPALQLDSPFPTENLAVFVSDRIRTDFRGRTSSYPGVARAIAAVVTTRPGNYLVFFPSYKYLETVRGEFQAANPFVPLIFQTPSMSDRDRQKFIAAFQSEITRSLVGFAVMGGVFGEGIDLVGERLVGAVVVGVGLPQLSLERDLIRAYFDEKNGLGFEYAYAYPGLNRVIQAAGRVIRSEVDRGVVLLIDARFGQERYRELLPKWWSVNRAGSEAELTERVGEFWGSKRL